MGTQRILSLQTFPAVAGVSSFIGGICPVRSARAEDFVYVLAFNSNVTASVSTLPMKEQA